jgi:GNAT superfamily N-acetyltransferase
MKFIVVQKNNLDLLDYFIRNIGEASLTFRYFNTRNIDVINQHLTTLLLIEEDVPVAYGHLEKEGEDIWLGVCVIPSFAGKGFGKLMMDELIANAKEKGISHISLTVDKVNLPAINLYEKLGFVKVTEEDFYFKYKLRL